MSCTNSIRRSRTSCAGSSEPVAAELARLQEDALFNGKYDGGRRGRLDQRRHRRHRRAGLGRDAAPHVPALVGRPRLPDGARRGEPGRGGGPEVGDDDGQGRERLRRLQGRARRAPARAAVAVRLGPPAPHRVRAGRGRAAPARRRGRRDRRGRPAHRHLPGERGRRAAREQDRLRRPHHASADRDRRPVPERALADLEQGDRDAHPQVTARRAAGGAAGGGAGARARRERRTSASGVKSAPTCCIRTRW